MNLYEILGVSSDCSMEILRQKYHKLLLEYHPDKTNSNDLITQKRFDDIQNAYKILSNVQLRLKYDQEQQRRYLHNLPHTNIHSKDFDDADEYICRCGTILEIDKNLDSHIIECPNCSTKIELKK
jgi:curved DNA-binding protein CbpA